MFGGSGADKDIALFTIFSKKWSRAGFLNQGSDFQKRTTMTNNQIENHYEGRYGHAVMVRQDDFLVIGGYSSTRRSLGTERCTMRNGQFDCTVINPYLNNYAYYPETIFVEQDFCIKS